METTEVTNAGAMPHRQRKLYTLVIPIEVDKKLVILGYKKRGFGVGKYNGYGGKVEPGETILQGAIRELEEESTLIAKEIHHIAILFLEAVEDPTQPILEIHVYALTEWEGEVQETEEMRPGYYSFDKAPSSTEQDTNGGQHPPVITSSGSAIMAPSFPHHPPIPYREMWEESKLWMEVFLSTLASNPAGSLPPKKFIHYVTFIGAHSLQLDKWDSWEGLDKSYIEYFDRDRGSEDISLWTDQKKDMWLGEKRKEMTNQSSINHVPTNQEVELCVTNSNSEYKSLTVPICPESPPAFLVEWTKKLQHFKAQSEKFKVEQQTWNVEKESWRKEIEERAKEKEKYLFERDAYLRETEEWKDEEKNWSKMMGISEEEKKRHLPGYRKWLDYKRNWVRKWERWHEMKGKWIIEGEERKERRTRKMQEYENWVRECEKWITEAEAWIEPAKEWIAANRLLPKSEDGKDEEMDNWKGTSDEVDEGRLKYETVDSRGQ